MARAKKTNSTRKKTPAASKKAKTDAAEKVEEKVETVTDAVADAPAEETAATDASDTEATAETSTDDAKTASDDVTEPATPDEEPQSAQDPEPTEDAPAVEDEPAKEDGPADEVAAEETKEPEEKPMEAAHPVPVPVEPEKSSGFWPMVFGGLVAGGIGFAIAELDLMGDRDPAIDVGGLTSAIDAQAERITSLEEAASVEAPAPDTGPLDALQEEIAGVRAEIAPLGDQIAAYEDRIAALEARPIAVAPDTGDADAYAEELARLQASVEEQRTEIQGLLDNALSVEEAAAQAAKASTAQAALARVTAAIAEGQPFEDAIGELQALGDVEVPAGLTDNAAGVVTLADLQTRFPDTARAALATARANTPDTEEGGLGGFLKRQLGARSVAPREGSGPDAVLSRAEDAVRNGRLSDALAEIVTLPDAAQGAMQDWLGDAQARDAAQAAANELAQRLTAN